MSEIKFKFLGGPHDGLSVPLSDDPHEVRLFSKPDGSALGTLDWYDWCNPQSGLWIDLIRPLSGEFYVLHPEDWTVYVWSGLPFTGRGWQAARRRYTQRSAWRWRRWYATS